MTELDENGGSTGSGPDGFIAAPGVQTGSVDVTAVTGGTVEALGQVANIEVGAEPIQVTLGVDKLYEMPDGSALDFDANDFEFMLTGETVSDVTYSFKTDDGTGAQKTWTWSATGGKASLAEGATANGDGSTIVTGSYVDGSKTATPVETQVNQTKGVSASKDGGSVTFDPITIAQTGVYTFQIAEVWGDQPAIYDTTNVTATVTVTEEDGKLVADVEYTYPGQQPADTAEITNVRSTGTVEVAKTVVSETEADHEREYAFTAALADETGAEQKVEGVKYVLVRADGTEDKYTLGADGAFKLEDGETARFLEIPSGWTLTATETEDLDKDAWTVTDDSGHAGDKTAEVKVEPNKVGATEFTNIHASSTEVGPGPDADARIEVEKRLMQGGDDVTAELAGGEFTFELTALDGAPLPDPATAETGADAHAVFGTIVYEKAGAYRYEIREVAGTDPSVEYDTATVIPVTVTVTKSADGRELQATVAYGENETADVQTVTNHRAEPAVVDVKADVEADKSLVMGGDPQELQGGEFSFELVKLGAGGAADTVIATGTNDADGNVAFTYVAGGQDLLTFDEPGTYEGYAIREVAGTDDALTYDGSEVKVSFEVTREGAAADLRLVAETVYDDGAAPAFQNIKATPAELEVATDFGATKTLLQDGEPVVAHEGAFAFELVSRDYDDQGDPVDTVIGTGTNAADGTVTFHAADGQPAELTYDQPGTYEGLLVREVAGDDDLYTYDTREVPVTVTVTKSADGTALLASVSYAGATELPVFTNQKADSAGAVIEAEKTLTRDGEAAEVATGEFTFELVDEAGAVVATGMSEAGGRVAFPELRFSDPGEHRYTIRERAGDVDGMSYSEVEHDVTVTVTVGEDGALTATVTYGTDDAAAPQIANTYVTPEPEDGGTSDGGSGETVPKTGDASASGAWVALVGALGAAAAGFAALRLRRRDDDA